MTTILNHDVRCVDGGTLWMPPWAGGEEGWGNMALPDVLVADTVQKYPISTKFSDGERVFRYCNAGSDITAMKASHCGNKPMEQNTDANAYAVGDTAITILDTDPLHLANYYAGGYIWIMSTVFRMHRIVSSTAVAASTSCVVTLETGLKTLISASTWTTAWANIYYNVLGTTTDKMSMVCVALIPVTSGSWFWGQTWGPCFGTSQNVVPGLTANQRDVFFYTDGALLAGDDMSLDTTVYQRAGFILTNTTDGGDQFYMLQLSP